MFKFFSSEYCEQILNKRFVEMQWTFTVGQQYKLQYNLRTYMMYKTVLDLLLTTSIENQIF